MQWWFVKNKDSVIYGVLFLIFLGINTSSEWMPAFSISFYESSAYFLWVLSFRLDILLLIGLFYLKTVLPKSFKNFLIACSFVVLWDIINLLPYEDVSVSFFYLVMYLGVGFGVYWLFLFVYNTNNLVRMTSDFKITTHEEKIKDLNAALEILKDADDPHTRLTIYEMIKDELKSLT